MCKTVVCSEFFVNKLFKKIYHNIDFSYSSKLFKFSVFYKYINFNCRKFSILVWTIYHSITVMCVSCLLGKTLSTSRERVPMQQPSYNKF